MKKPKIKGSSLSIIAILIALASFLIPPLPDEIIDEIPPVVGILDPDNDQIISGEITIRAQIWEISNNYSISILMNGSEIGNKIPLKWNSSDVEDGNYNLTVVATDKTGNKGQDQIIISVKNSVEDDEDVEDEKESPLVTIIEPGYNKNVTGIIIIRTLVIEESDYNLTIYINGTSVGSDLLTLWNTSEEVYDKNCWYNITAEAVDAFGNKGNDTVFVFLITEALEEDEDNTAPFVVIINPGYFEDVIGIIAISTLIIEESDYNLTVYINGTSVGSDNLIFWNTSEEIYDKNCWYNISVYVIDVFGNIGSDTIFVYLITESLEEDEDNTAPMVVIIEPSYEETVMGRIFIDTLVIEESDYNLTVLINGTSVGTDDLVFWNGSDPIYEKNCWYNITSEAVDFYGNKGSDTVFVYLVNDSSGLEEQEDTNAPIVHIMDPNYGETITGPTVIRSFVDSSGENITVLVNGTKIGTDLLQVWNTSSCINDYYYNITVLAVDQNNNIGKDQILVLFNNQTSPSGEDSNTWYLNTTASYSANAGVWTTVEEMTIDFDVEEGELAYFAFNCRATIWDNNIKLHFLIDGQVIDPPLIMAQIIDTIEITSLFLQHAVLLSAGNHNVSVQIYKESPGISQINYCTFFVETLR